MIFRHVFPGLLLLLMTLGAFSQSGSSETLSQEIDLLMTKLHDEGIFNGTVAVTKQGQTIYQKAFGMADFRSQRPLATRTPFYLASVSKQITTMCIMMLEESGDLSYDDRLSTYFPKFPAYAKGVTIRQMMQHISGIANHYSLGIYRPGLTNHDVLLELQRQANTDFEPGSKYSYSNGGYVLLAMIVEKVSGMRFADFVSSRIFQPLRMTRSMVVDEHASLYEDRARGFTPIETLDDYVICTTGAGGIYSTVEDLAKWDRALYSDVLVSQETLNKAFTPAVLTDGTTVDYGFGWGVQTKDDGRQLVSHGGSMNGFRTRIVRDLENQTGIILLTNHTNLLLPRIASCIDQVLIGEPCESPTVKDMYPFLVSDYGTVIDVLYAVISGEAGEKRDWDLFRYLFKEGAHLIPTRQNGELTYMRPEDYVKNSGAWLEQNGFFEREIHRKTERFGSLVQVFSTYESYRSAQDTEPFARGINSIQLHNDGDRWWIVNIFWNAETDELSIPASYLPKD